MDNNRPSSVDVRFKQFIPGIAWFFLVLFLLCLPGKDVPKIVWMDSLDFDKLIHCGLFGMMVMLFCLPFRKSPINRQQKIIWFIKITLSACVWGITSELIQRYFIPGRSFDLLDWAADSLGALLAYFFCKKFFA